MALRFSKKLMFIAVGVLAVLIAVGLIFLRDIHPHQLIETTMGYIRHQGPWLFFIAMALAPVIGFPLLAFTLTAGAAFSDQLGIVGVIAATTCAIAVNLALTYWLARYALRPFIEKLIHKMGHKVPDVPDKEKMELAIMLRITPGPPFFLQSYILGIAEMPFLPYMLISIFVPATHAAAFTVFGESIMHGKGWVALTGLSLLVGVMIIVHLVRKHYGRRKKQS